MKFLTNFLGIFLKLSLSVIGSFKINYKLENTFNKFDLNFNFTSYREFEVGMLRLNLTRIQSKEVQF